MCLCVYPFVSNVADVIKFTVLVYGQIHPPFLCPILCFLHIFLHLSLLRLLPFHIPLIYSLHLPFLFVPLACPYEPQSRLEESSISFPMCVFCA